MKCAAVVLCATLLFASCAAAQSFSPAPEYSQMSSVVNFARLFGPGAVTANANALAAPAAALPATDAASAVHEPLYGVLPGSNFEAYGGFTYFRFYEVPGTTGNLAGLNVSLAYFPHGGHVGVDGEFAVGFASQNGGNTIFEAGTGGGRFRINAARHTEIWVHALAGGAHFSPRTPYGSQAAFAFEAGGGADWSPRDGSFAFRIQADLLGTYFFSTHQYGPKISLGVVYRF